MTHEQQAALNKYYHNTTIYENLAKIRAARWYKAVSSKEELEKFANELIAKKNTTI